MKVIDVDDEAIVIDFDRDDDYEQEDDDTADGYDEDD
mgnify:CR=1 FL=1